jgi:hypothetical protein
MLRTAALFLVVLVTGCSQAYIANTDVEDNTPNRKVVTFCEDYRHAVEDRNIVRLLAMASPRYHEDSGTPAGDDDMDFDGLKGFLTAQFQGTSAIRYEIRYRKVTFTQSGHVWVDYTYAASFRVPGVKGEEWRHSVAENRLDLVADGESYKIVSGM